MSTATQYLVKNINKTYDIYNSIEKMQNEVLSKLEKNFRQSFSSWVDEGWFCPDDYKLVDDWSISAIRKEWSYCLEDKEIKAYIWTSLELGGDDPIWRFFGLPSDNEDNRVYLQLELSEQFKQLENFQDLIIRFDEENETRLTAAGFIKKGGSINRSYSMEISFNKDHILSGLNTDDWDQANRVLKDAWKVFQKIEWKFLLNSMKSHKKT